MRKLSGIYNPINDLQISFQTNCKSKNLFFYFGALYVLYLLNMFLIYMTCAKTHPILVMLSIKLRMLFIHLNYMRMFT